MADHKPLSKQKVYEFARFRLDASAGLLSFDNETVKIAPKVFQCLVMIVDADGAVVSKEDLLDAVWPGENPPESVLAYTVSQLRKTLSASDPDTKFIETLSKRGFRMNVPVRRLGELPMPKAFETEIVEREVVEEVWIEEIDDAPSIQFGRPRIFRAGIFASIVTLILAVAVLGAFFALRKWNAAPSRVQSLAVLPLKTFNSDDADEALRLRIMDAMISRLGAIRNISVRPTSATAKFIGSSEDPVAIGRTLEVDAVLEGRIQRENNRLRVTVQMIDVRSGAQVWAEQFDGDEGRSLDLQDAVAAKLAVILDHPSDRQGASGPMTKNAVAYEEYLRGRYLWGKRTYDALKSSIAAYQRAVELDPNFAEAYVGMADSYYTIADYAYDTNPDVTETARRNLARGLELQPELANAYTTRSLIESTTDWNWKAAEASARKAIELMPNSASGHHRLGSVLMLQRRFAEAETEFRRARDLDPTSTAINMNVGVVLCFSKRFEEARIQLERTIELDRGFTAPKWFLARCLGLMGEHRQSHALIAEALEIEGDRELASKIRRISETSDNAAVMRELLLSWEKQVSPTGITPHDMANINARLGNVEETLRWLEKSVEIRHPWSVSIYAAPEFDLVREHPRYIALLKRMNFI